ncbi:MAG: nucleoside deaminase [Clostridia bacterium]
MNTKDNMQLAMLEMYKAGKKLEVPVGAVIVRNGKVIARAHNLKETKQNALYHAEILAIKKACKKLHSWRLDDCEMYVTLEPCPMCAGAIISARIKKLYIGALDEKFGAVISNYQICDDTRIGKKVESIHLESYEPQIKKCLQDFFKSLRKNK